MTEQESYIEFTTTIGNGRGDFCVVNCRKYCPQELIVPHYMGDPVMTFDTFKSLMQTVPIGLPVFFSGRSEPFQNQSTIDMIEWAHKRGHPITIFSTLTGLTPEHAKRLVKIPITKLVLHLPDPIAPCEYFKSGICCVGEMNGYCPKSHFPFIVNTECGGVKNAKIPNHSPTYQATRAIIEDWNVPKEYMDMGPTFKSNLCEGMTRGNTRTQKSGKRSCIFLDAPGYQVQPNGDVSFCCMVRGLTEIVGNLNESTYAELAAKHAGISKRLANDPNSICHRCVVGQKYWLREFMKFKDRMFNGRSIMQVLSNGLLEDK